MTQLFKNTKIGDIPVDWDVVKLGEITNKIGSGVTPRGGKEVYLNNGHIYFIRSQNVLNGILELDDIYITEKQHSKMKNTQLKPNDVLLNITGASIGRSCVVPKSFSEGNVNQHVCIIRTKSIFNPYFLSNYLNSHFGQKLIYSYQAGGNREGLSIGQIKSFQIPLPPLPEQKKIAKILTTWDKAISTLTALIAAKEVQKRGLMQQLILGEIRVDGKHNNQALQKTKLGLIPKDWAILKMSETFNKVSERNTKNVKDVLTISAKSGFLNQKDKFSKVIAGKNLDKYTLLRKGDFSYNKGNSKTAPYGCIFKLKNYDIAAVPNVYFSFKAKIEIDTNFFEYFFEQGVINQQLARIINTGVRNDGLMNIHFKDFFKIKSIVPSLEEQTKIAKILSTADKEIALLKEELEKIEEQKRGLMQVLLTGKVRVQVS